MAGPGIGRCPCIANRTASCYVFRGGRELAGFPILFLKPLLFLFLEPLLFLKPGAFALIPVQGLAANRLIGRVEVDDRQLG